MINKIKHSPNDTLVVSIGGFNALFGSFLDSGLCSECNSSFCLRHNLYRESIEHNELGMKGKLLARNKI